MNNPICISTGCVYKLSDDRNRLIKELRKLSPRGIEISFAHPDYLLNFELSKENLDYLKSLEFNSIHAPWIDISYSTDQRTKEVLDAISKIYKQINGRCVVFHEEQIKDYTLINSAEFVPAIENDDWRKPRHRVEDIRTILDDNPKFKFTFDFAHALTVSSLDVPSYISSFNNRLIEVHFSIVDREVGRHDLLYKHDNEEIKNMAKELKNVSQPFVLEGVSSDLNEMKKEVEYLKSI
jgi:hypothetical protein